jgi:hypothetical protein
LSPKTTNTSPSRKRAMAAAVFMAALLSSFHSGHARCAAVWRSLGQAVFQPFAMKIRRI